MQKNHKATLELYIFIIPILCVCNVSINPKPSFLSNSSAFFVATSEISIAVTSIFEFAINRLFLPSPSPINKDGLNQ